MPGGDDISVREIAAMLRQRVATYVPQLLPGGRRQGRHWEAGSVEGEKGQSLKLDLTGPNQGTYTDFSAAEGTWQRSGDVLTLVCHLRFGGRMADAVKWAKSELGLDDLDPARVKQIKRDVERQAAEADKAAEGEKEKNRSRAWHLWRGAVPIVGTPAQAYLETRIPGVVEALERAPGCLRYRPDVWCPIRSKRRDDKFPAMIACIMALDGRLLAVHRTWLDISGWDHATRRGPVRVVKVADAKGRLKSHKQTLGEYAGGCIPLWKGACQKTLREIDAGTPVYCSEGIEDGLTIAAAAPDKRVVAGVALSNMGSLALPDQAGPLIFIGQNDPIGSKAVDAFERVVQRQQEAGRSVELIFPRPEFKDFNDQLLGKAMERAG